MSAGRKLAEVERHDLGPRRSASVDSYLRETRAIAAVAVLALAGGVVSDALAGRFWGRHALLGGLGASLIGVVLSVARGDGGVERRRARGVGGRGRAGVFGPCRDRRVTWAVGSGVARRR